MPRRGGNAAKAAKIADILAKFDIQTDSPVIPEQDYQSDTATAVFAWVPEGFQANICGECKKPFAHNQIIKAGSRVGYCSDACRRDSFEKAYGVKWFTVDINKEPWDGDPPLVISPEQFVRLEKLADWFIKNRKLLETRRRSIEPEQQKESLEENGYHPNSQVLLQEEFDLFADRSTSESTDLHPVVLHTTPGISQEPLILQRNLLEDDPFGF